MLSTLRGAAALPVFLFLSGLHSPCSGLGDTRMMLAYALVAPEAYATPACLPRCTERERVLPPAHAPLPRYLVLPPAHAMPAPQLLYMHTAPTRAAAPRPTAATRACRRLLASAQVTACLAVLVVFLWGMHTLLVSPMSRRTLARVQAKRAAARM